jgi:hypothetical protein
MAVLTINTVNTLLDLAKLHNQRQLLDIAEVLEKKNGLFKTAHWEEANQLSSHVFTKEIALASGTWRQANEGIAASASQNGQQVENMGRVEGRNEIDEYLMDIEPKPKEFRYKKDMQNLRGYTQDAVDAFLYGNPAVTVGKPRGIQVRYNTLTITPDNVQTAGSAAAGVVTSVYVCQWGPGRLALIYPREKLSELVKMEDMGLRYVITDTTNNKGLFKYITRFYTIFGIVPYDDRAVQRICNVGTTGANEVDIDQLLWAFDSLPDPEDTSGSVCYVNRLTRFQITKALRNRPNLYSTSADEYGRQVERLRTVPMVLLENIKLTETVVA